MDKRKADLIWNLLISLLIITNLLGLKLFFSGIFPVYFGSAQSPLPLPLPLPSVIPSPPSHYQNQTSILQKAIQDASSALQPGQIAWNPPEEMTLDEPKIIVLKITDDLQRDLNNELESSTVIAGIEVSTFMKANLSGSAFNIESQTPEKQALPPQSIAEWRWKVTPTDEGEQVLSISVYARAKIPGQSAEEDLFLESYSKTLDVRVDPASFFKSNWKWIVENPGNFFLWSGAVATMTVAATKKWKQIKRWLAIHAGQRFK